jgi:cyclophilin family peptidyl-prolyl cis-trans isomerase
MRRFLSAAIFAAVFLMLALPAAFAQDAQTPEEICADAVPAEEPETREFEAPEQVLEEGVDYRAIFCTESGPVYVDLFEEFTPLTVNSFVFLAQEGYYNNTTFHRVLEDFMAQGGDPTGTGSGGPGYQFRDEFVGFLNFDRPGWLAMANAGAGTNGSQFFITTVPTPHLDNAHTIFGEVLEGQENVEALQLRDPAAATEPGAALETVVIITDPSTVTTTYEAPEPATEEQFQAALDAISQEVPPPLAINEEATGIFEAGAVVATAPQALQEDYAAFLEEHNFEYRVSNDIVNAECDLETAPYTEISYMLDVFASRDDASAALADGLLQQIPVEAGLTEFEQTIQAPYPVYTETITDCDTEVTHAVTHWQRGRYVITAEATYADVVDATPDVWLTQLVGTLIYERLFSDVLRTELR